MRIIISKWKSGTNQRFALAGAILAISLVLVAAGMPAEGQSLEDALESISIEDLQDKIGYLASDEFRGRGNGTEDLDRAAEYVAGVFDQAGLTPAGDDGFFQEFQVNRPSMGANNVVRVVFSESRDVDLSPGSDFIPYTISPSVEITAPLTFVGYGIRAPELDYDDLAGMDLSGRIAVVMESYPRDRDDDSPFDILSDVDLSSTEVKAQNVLSAGAVGMILVQGPDSRDVTSIAYFSRAMRPNLPPRDAVMDLALAPEDPAIPIVIVSRRASSRVLPSLEAYQSQIDEELQPHSIDLPTSATIRVDLDLNPYTARNVVAMIEGSDPDLRNEVIVVGAHYDHDGERGNQIWNGADDNASGTSGLLELAEAFAIGVRPSRSVILAAWAGEEKGMLGSRFYVRNAAVPIEDTIAMFQIDMIGRNEDHKADREEGFLDERAEDNGNALNMIGSVFSPDLRETFEDVNEDVGLDLRFRYDYRAENLMRRSDHWSFLTQRVPSIFLFGGLHPDYHTPNDTADKINYEKVENVIELVYLTLLEVGDSPVAPVFIDPSDER
jgi:hypothetical protein